ncbi:MAG TPA: sulfatase-like hydrolase/transferase [Candidatus Polarisedimenticolia bacterium]|nr:sulfatase-like hydrolase/transferase [Candidatus Polarisedimenticolia bacterium]
MSQSPPPPAAPMRPWLRKTLSIAAFLFVLAVLSAVALRSTRLVTREQAGWTGRYNVLLITVDTLRADHLGCYGDSAAQTPVIDRLAADGVLFERAETSAPITLPAHVSILTGTYPAYHGVRNNGVYRLGPRAVTLAEVLHDHGYQTGAVISGYPLATRFGLSQGFDTYDDHLPAEKTRQIGFRERRAEEVSRRGNEWLATVGQRRFFLWLHFFDPHAPYDPPPPLADRFPHAPYDGEVAYVDQEIGRVLEKLESLGQLSKTVIVLVADHGEGLGDHGEATHGVFLYESTIRVPMILSLPGPLPRGRRVATPVRTIDLMPTLLRLVDLPAPEELQGTSLLPLTSRRPPDLLLKSLSESLLPRENYGWSELSALRIGDWKFILAPRQELYDLRTDPGEKKNLAATRDGDASRMKEEIHRLMQDAAVSGAPIAYRQELDETARERLRSLGYLWAPGPAASSVLPDPKDRIALLDGLDAARELYARGEFARAVARYDEVLSADPGNVTALFHRGNAKVEAGDFAGGAADFEAVLVQRPRSPEVLLNLGGALLGQGLLNESSRIFRQVIDLDSDSDKAYAGLAKAVALQGKPADAAELFTKALSFNPDSKDARQGLAAALAAGGKREEAEAALRSAAEADPQDVGTVVSLAKVLYDSGRYDEVVASMEKALREGLDAPEIHYALGNALFKKGEVARASEEYDRVLSKAPAHSGALFGAALVALKTGRGADAIRLLERSRASEPGNQAARRNLAILYDEAGRNEEAIAEYRALLGLNPGASDIRFHLAEVYARSGRREEARRELTAYLASGGGEFREAAQAALGRLGK